MLNIWPLISKQTVIIRMTIKRVIALNLISNKDTRLPTSMSCSFNRVYRWVCRISSLSWYLGKFPYSKGQRRRCWTVRNYRKMNMMILYATGYYQKLLVQSSDCTLSIFNECGITIISHGIICMCVMRKWERGLSRPRNWK